MSIKLPPLSSVCWIGIAAIALSARTDGALAEVKLPAIFSDHVVLQRDMPAPVWGWAEPGESVEVSIANQTHSATANETGKWRVTLEPLALGPPLKLVVEGTNRIEVADVLVGDVWLCSGQSNMQHDVRSSQDPDLQIPTANFSQIRLITVPGQGSQTPVEDFDGQWELCSPATVGEFSAVGYFFGRELHEQLGVPIGLIDNSWGASACEAWIRRELLEGNPLYQSQLKYWDQKVAEFDEPVERAKFEQASAEWDEQASAAKKAGRPAPPNRLSWYNPATGQHRPGNVFHARIEPLVPFAIRGVIWYQGETNAARAFQYREMFPLLIQSWRDEWGQGDFSFYWVQLADFLAERTEPGNSAWAELREAQTMTLDRLPNTGQAVAIDLGEATNIHPRNKLDVGKRLARWALARDYGRDIECESPRYESMERKGDKLVVRFRHVGRGLGAVDGKELNGFAIAGDDRHWVWADARVVGRDRVEVWSDAVENPVAVRYAWADNPVANLYNSARLPATPFRTDDWPGFTDHAR